MKSFNVYSIPLLTVEASGFCTDKNNLYIIFFKIEKKLRVSVFTCF